MSLLAVIQQVEREIRGITRKVDTEKLSAGEKRMFEQIQLACNELKLDIRDYEYAESRAEQVKWAKIGKHNLRALESYILQLNEVFAAADVAQISAQLHHVGDKLD
jgi:hypothetical protein